MEYGLYPTQQAPSYQKSSALSSESLTHTRDGGVTLTCHAAMPRAERMRIQIYGAKLEVVPIPALIERLQWYIE